MHEARVDAELCDGCQDCLEVCVYDAIALVRFPPSRRLKAVVDPVRCCGCMACGPPLCPRDGIELVPIRLS
ncbi:MAG: hypothetical protein IT304_09895 [Dehalococcoidia bacterium]|nr:hypothetical protein [Dehalococcoidia bacterium]